jgi:O-methyltransferase
MNITPPPPIQSLKIIVFGARDGAISVKERLERECLPIEIVAFADNDINLQNSILFDKPVIAPKNISSFEYDQIIISTINMYFTNNIVEQLTNEYNIPLKKINTKFAFTFLSWEARLVALNNASELIIHNNIKGEVAELGVFRGNFAQHINKLFPDKKLYLFDTFEGFSTNDVEKDLELGSSNKIMDRRYDFSNTNVNFVLNRMVHPENCIIKKGYFPKTVKKLEEKFAFVSLDADLYQPMFEGLKYFYPHLERGGYIFIHDFFNENFPGTKKAVLEYKNIENIHYVPLGDTLSIAVVKM